jgi:exodeoxyribonuclease-3
MINNNRQASDVTRIYAHERVVSWNVNGIRAAHRKGFLTWLQEVQPEFLCLQETRAMPSQLDSELLELPGYYTFWNPALNKAGYGGTCLICREKPLSIELGIGIDSFDIEGRTIIAKFKDLIIINCYVPNGNSSEARLDFKLEYLKALVNKCAELLLEVVPVLCCGDFNVTHTNNDLAQPKANRGKTGVLPEERQFMDQLLSLGYVDSYRLLNPLVSPPVYSWYSYKKSSREKNIGWRFDYCFFHCKNADVLKDAYIWSEVQISDHCPIGISLARSIS